MINKVILVGNVGADPECRTLENGTQVSKFKIATSETYKDKEGNKKTNTEWHTVVFWRGLATVVERFVSKGSPLYIEGKITYRSYEKDNETKYFTEIVGSELKLLGRNNSSQGHNNESEPSTTNNNGSFVDENNNGDDLPF